MRWLHDFVQRRRAAMPIPYPLALPLVMHGSMAAVTGTAIMQRGFDKPVPLALAGLLATTEILAFLFWGVRLPPAVVTSLGLAASTMFFFLWPPIPLDATPFLLSFIAGSVGAEASVRASAASTAACAAFLVAVASAHRLTEPVVYVLFFVVFGWSMGLIMQLQQRLLLQVRETQTSLAEQAAGEERRRIAREVHDVVAHSLSITLLHLTGARRALQEDRDVDDAVAGLVDAERLGRQAMADIRRTVGLLDTGGANGHRLAPERGAADIQALVDDFAQAGVAVDYRVEGDLRAVSAWVGLGLYRVAQESLANIAKHAPNARAVLRLRITKSVAELSVDNAALPVAGGAELSAAGGGVPHPPPHPNDTAGSGVAGMRRRVELLGGKLYAGPVPGGWSVRAGIPLGPSTASSRMFQTDKSARAHGGR
ncbi:MAG: sensor histidine kinase [Segniliparus sp.]|uniref:sensor histidine kinase n=1 Tax=Segniliparus sp. TaxID=2804064 RepID=UPI003F3B0EE2